MVQVRDLLGHKLVDLQTASQAAETWRSEGKRVVLTNGCFDLMHPGHVHILNKAKSEGDHLIVALNSDPSVRRLKGDARPIQDAVSRALMIASVKDVDLITIFEEDTPAEVIKAIRPDILVKGTDYTVKQVVGAEFVHSYGGRVSLIPLLEGYSTTKSILR